MTLKEFMQHNERERGEFPDDLSVTLGGRYRNTEGKEAVLVGFDFHENAVSLYLGNNLYWEGSGQEFSKVWAVA